MKNKIIISVVAIVVLTAAVFSIITFNSKLKQKSGGEEIYSNMEDAAKNAAFDMEYPDRLCGIPAVGFESNSSMIEVRYGDGDYVRKTLGVADNSSQTDHSETVEQIINGISVTFKGDGGLVYLAIWNYNNFAFTISVSEGVDADEMTEYVESTR